MGGEKLRIPVESSQIYESLNETDINLKLRKEFRVIVIKRKCKLLIYNGPWNALEKERERNCNSREPKALKNLIENDTVPVQLL